MLRAWSKEAYNLEKPKSAGEAILYCLELGMSRALTEHSNLDDDEMEEVLKYAALYFTQELAASKKSV